jgi:rubrerythrin
MNDIIKALKTALSMEKTGYDLYIKASNNTKNTLGKSTFEAIAKKELDHIKGIEEFASHNFDVALAAVENQTKKDYCLPIMKELESELNKKVMKDADLENAYKAAMKLEKDSYSFYKNLNERSDDHKAKEFFEFLMKEENTHYELLEETMEYLNKPGNWYRETERWIVEG